MKVFLTRSLEASRNGYVSVNPARGNLDGLVEAGEASEVVALGVLDFFKPEQQHEMLAHWASRLAPGGVITVSCTDLYEVARSLVLGGLDEGAAAGILYGEKVARRAVINSELTLQGRLRSLGLEVLTRRVDQYTCVVTARRPR